jgi:hypothetical protein
MSGVQTMMKAAAWENAKGAVRASVALVGSTDVGSVQQDAARRAQWAEFHSRCEAFIKDIEKDGLCE